MGDNTREIVKYDNKLNKLDLSTFSSLELNLFYCALCKLKGKSTNTVTIGYDEICLIANLKKTNPQYVFDRLKEIKEKIFHLSLDPLGISKLDEIDYEKHLFMDWKNDKANETLTFSIHPDFAWLINNNRLGFTSFELLEFVNMKSIYAKNLFRNLKQWKKKGEWKVSLQELKAGLCVSPKTKDEYISSRILKPAVNEIREKTDSFSGLHFEGVYEGKSHKLSGFAFYWDPEDVSKMIAGPKNQKKEGVAFYLENESLTCMEYDALKEEFPEEVVDKTIDRILEKPYVGCLNADTIRQWCSEAVEYEKTHKKPKNAFHNFDQRHDYDFEELEKRLFKV